MFYIKTSPPGDIIQAYAPLPPYTRSRGQETPHVFQVTLNTEKGKLSDKRQKKAQKILPLFLSKNGLF